MSTCLPYKDEYVGEMNIKINATLAPDQYLTGLTLFFIGYVLFEVNKLHADARPTRCSL